MINKVINISDVESIIIRRGKLHYLLVQTITLGDYMEINTIQNEGLYGIESDLKKIGLYYAAEAVRELPRRSSCVLDSNSSDYSHR